MKTIYISDLDGTLLDGEATLPENAARGLRALADHGVNITYATARTIKSVKYILKDAPTEYPIALMNGVLICSLADGAEHYLSAAYLKNEDFDAVREALSLLDVTPFMYFLDGDELTTAYTEITNDYMENFMAERVKKYNKPFVRLESGQKFPGKPIYFAAMDTEEKIKAANEACLALGGVKTACYRDSYVKDVWYLEVFDRSASKKEATLEIKRLTGADRVVTFGDNFNDVPMFEAAHESYAVETAPEEVIAAADGTVPTAPEGGVVRKIAELEKICGII